MALLGKSTLLKEVTNVFWRKKREPPVRPEIRGRYTVSHSNDTFGALNVSIHKGSERIYVDVLIGARAKKIDAIVENFIRKHEATGVVREYDKVTYTIGPEGNPQ